MARQNVGKVLVIIPTYNERESLPIVVAGVKAIESDVDILIVDDNSPDGTGEVADQLCSTHKGVQVLHRASKAGLGAAYLAGFTWASENGYDIVVEMDADGSHQPTDLPKLLNAMTNNDVVLGSRWIPGGSVVNWPKRRIFLSRGGNLYTRALLGMSVHDATGGFRALRITAIQKLHLEDVQSQGYCFQVDLALRASDANLRLTEVPITFIERELGESKMDGAIVREALWLVTKWGIKKRLTDLKHLFRR